MENIYGVKTPCLIRTAFIDDNPGPYCMSFGFDTDALSMSILKIGLVNPLIVTNSIDDKRYLIVVGYRRLIALKHLKRKDVYCIDLSKSGLSPLDLLLLNLYDNLSTRIFNDVEKGMILRRLSAYFSREMIEKNFMPLLKIGKSNSLDLFLKIDSLNDHLKYSLTNGILSFKAFKLMVALDSESFLALFRLIENIKPNFNYQFYLTEHLTYISKKEGLPVSVILEDEKCKAILNDKNDNNPQKSKNLLKHFWARRYPNLSDSVKSFNKSIARLNLPDRIKINPPPFFESSDYKLELLFRDGNELYKKLGSLLQKQDELFTIKDPW